MPAPEKSGLQILIVDDEPSVARSIKMLLEHSGHTVQAAASGEAGLALFDQARFDVVITDFFMAGMDGDQLAAHIKRRRPAQPVIMATASLYGRNTADHPSEHVDYLLNKPFTLAELRAAIAWVLR